MITIKILCTFGLASMMIAGRTIKIFFIAGQRKGDKSYSSIVFIVYSWYDATEKSLNNHSQVFKSIN